MTATHATTTALTARAASWRNLGLTYVAGVALLAVQSVAYHHWSHGDNSLASDLPFYVVAGLVGALVAALALVRVRRSHRETTAATVGVVLGALALVIFPVGYYMPITFIWGGTAHLLGRDAGSGRAAGAARLLGVVAMLCQVAVVVARLCGVTYQIGG